MTLTSHSQGQRIIVKRNTLISDEEFKRQCEKLLKTMKVETVVSPGRTIRVGEDDGETRTFRTGDPIEHGSDIRSRLDWEDLARQKDLLTATKSQLMVNLDDPAARFLVGDTALSLPGKIYDVGEVICEQNCAQAADPSKRSFIQGSWVEPGEFRAADDGSETFQRLLDLGRIIDRTLVGKVKTAVKRAVSSRSVSK
jgi:hypothetical protein